MRSRFSQSPLRRLPGQMTTALLIVFSAGFLLSWIPSVGEVLRYWLAFDPARVLPWTPITYPFVTDGNGGGILFFILGMLWWYWVGSGLERTTGPWGLLLNFLAASFLEALMCLFASMLGMRAGLMGQFLPVSFMTVAFCARDPESQIQFWGIIPVKYKILALITGLIVVFGFGTGQPILGLMVGAPLVLAWFYGAGKLPVTLAGSSVDRNIDKRRENKEFDEFMTKVKSKEKEREERDRLRKLFEDSMSKDD